MKEAKIYYSQCTYIEKFRRLIEAVQTFDDYSGVVWSLTMKPVLWKEWWFMMIDSAGLKKQEAIIDVSDVGGKRASVSSIRTKAWWRKYENCKIVIYFCTFHLWLSVAVIQEKKFKWPDHWIEIQLFCYIIYSQFMGNGNGLLTWSIPIIIPYDAIFSKTWWSITFCLYVWPFQLVKTGSRLI